jgi:hypothetical protein
MTFWSDFDIYKVGKTTLAQNSTLDTMFASVSRVVVRSARASSSSAAFSTAAARYSAAPAAPKVAAKKPMKGELEWQEAGESLGRSSILG